MKNSFFAIALGLSILSCNYDQSSNGNIDEAYAKEDYAAVHGEHKKEMREKRQNSASTIQKKEEQQVVEVKDSTVAPMPAAAPKETTNIDEVHH